MKVQFLKNTAAAKLPELPAKTLLIYRADYNLPDLAGVEYIDIDEYRKSYLNLHPNMIIFVGLNRLITPSNRCDFVFEYLSTLTPNIPKISIDSAPFIGEPWRLWYHYFFTRTGKFNIAYSYAIETEWKHWFYRDANDCRLSGDNVAMFITETYSDLEQLTTSFSFYDVNDIEREYYEEAKKFVFNKYATPKLWANNLLKTCNRYFNVDLSMDSYLRNKKICLPDLNIYRFVAGENLRRRDIYNAVIKTGRGDNETIY